MKKKMKFQFKAGWLKVALILVSFFVVVGVTYAYFTSQGVSAELVFQTGSLKIDLTDPTQLSFSNLKPGDEQLVEYSVKNTGTMSVYLKGKFTGGWQEAGLDNSKLQPTKLEYQLNGGDWVMLVNDGLAIDEEYFYSSTDNEATLIELPVNAVVYWRATFRLASEVGDNYQNQEYKTQIHLTAKQIKDEAGWSESY